METCGLAVITLLLAEARPHTPAAIENPERLTLR
jgi:hypothetical protein